MLELVDCPYYTIGTFSTDDTIGPDLTYQNIVYALPREKAENTFTTKGTNQIGVFVDGVPAYSDASPNSIVQGYISYFTVVERGRGYQNPTVVLDPLFSTASAQVENGQIVCCHTNPCWQLQRHSNPFESLVAKVQLSDSVLICLDV